MILFMHYNIFINLSSIKCILSGGVRNKRNNLILIPSRYRKNGGTELLTYTSNRTISQFSNWYFS